MPENTRWSRALAFDVVSALRSSLLPRGIVTSSDFPLEDFSPSFSVRGSEEGAVFGAQFLRLGSSWRKLQSSLF